LEAERVLFLAAQQGGGVEAERCRVPAQAPRAPAQELEAGAPPGACRCALPPCPARLARLTRAAPAQKFQSREAAKKEFRHKRTEEKLAKRRALEAAQKQFQLKAKGQNVRCAPPPPHAARRTPHAVSG
jgi:hypothetical protein